MSGEGCAGCEERQAVLLGWATTNGPMLALALAALLVVAYII